MLPRLSVGPAIRVSYSVLLLLRASSSYGMGNKQAGVPVRKVPPKPQVTFSDAELRQRLSQEEYEVTQNKGTERPWTSQYLDVNEDGTFTCVVCGNELFKTTKKFESGSGWPSFSDVASQSSSVVRIVDESYGMVRTEVVCGKCSAHLGHMFDDGPKDTCLRYCINGASLQFSGKGAGSKANERVEDGEKEEEDGVGEMKQKVVEGEREEEKAEVVGEKEKAEVEDGEKEEDGGVGEMKQKEAEGEREEEKAEVVGEKEKAEVEDGEKEEEAGVGEMKQNEVEGEREEEKAEAVGEKEKAEVEGENEEEGEGEREGKQKEERSKEEEGTARGEGVEEGQCESAEPK